MARPGLLHTLSHSLYIQSYVNIRLVNSKLAIDMNFVDYPDEAQYASYLGMYRHGIWFGYDDTLFDMTSYCRNQKVYHIDTGALPSLSCLGAKLTIRPDQFMYRQKINNNVVEIHPNAGIEVLINGLWVGSTNLRWTFSRDPRHLFRTLYKSLMPGGQLRTYLDKLI